MKGWLLPAADDPARARNAAETVDMKEEVFRLVAPDNVIRYDGGPLKVLLVDAGAKDNMVRSLLKRGATVVRAPGTLTSRRSPPSTGTVRRQHS
jgi:carbamoyl-phosphate synthase small subunit